MIRLHIWKPTQHNDGGYTFIFLLRLKNIYFAADPCCCDTLHRIKVSRNPFARLENSSAGKVANVCWQVWKCALTRTYTIFFTSATIYFLRKLDVYISIYSFRTLFRIKFIFWGRSLHNRYKDKWRRSSTEI